MIKRIGEILFDAKEYLILTFIIIICLSLIFSNDNRQVRFLRAAAVGFIGTFQSGVSVIPNVFDIDRENKYLRETNIKLANEVSELKEARLENIRLKRLLNFKERTNLQVISAKILNKSLTEVRNTITLDVGKDDGIEPGMPVITDAGLVGRIASVSGKYAIAQILMNKDLNISVKSQRTRTDGILSWDGPGNLIVKNVPKSADVNAGDVIITSEYSRTFPPGIPVGVVAESANLDNLFRRVVLIPAVNFEILEEVFVLKYLSDKDRADLEKTFTQNK